MARICRWLVLVLVVMAAVVAPRILRFVKMMRLGHVVQNQQPGPCENIRGLEDGSEDMQALSNGMTFITTGLMSGNGKIMMFDINNPAEGARQMDLVNEPPVLIPHGITIWQDEDGISVLVVNHAAGHTVDRFAFDAKSPLELQYIETFRSEAFVGVNDLVALGHRQFYFTNCQYYPWFTLRFYIELVGTFPFGTVGYFDGNEGSIVREGLYLPNGINMSPDHRYLYLVNSGHDQLIVYEVHQGGSLLEKQVFETDCGLIDNINVDPSTGDIWAAVHPVSYKAFKFFLLGIQELMPAKALRFKTQDGLLTSAVQVYADDGEQYVSGVTVALRHHDKLVLGTLAQKAAICDVMFDM